MKKFRVEHIITLSYDCGLISAESLEEAQQKAKDYIGQLTPNSTDEYQESMDICIEEVTE